MKRHWKVVLVLTASALLVFLGMMVVGCVQPVKSRPTSDYQTSAEVQMVPTQKYSSPTTEDKVSFPPTAQGITPNSTYATIPTFTPTIGQLAFTSMTITPEIPSILEAYADGDRSFSLPRIGKVSILFK